MKFTNIVALVASAATAYASACGSECDPSKGLNGKTYQKDLVLVAVQDNKDPNIHYKVGGTIVVKDDCHFEVQNFYVDPSPRNAFWTCNKKGENEGVRLMGEDETVAAVNPAAPVTLSYDVHYKPNAFCQASLLNDCYDYSLYDDSWQLIATAKAVNPDATGSGGSSGSSGSGSNSSGSNNSSSTGKTNGGKDTSDATTSKWSMALLGLSSLAAYLLA